MGLGGGEGDGCGSAGLAVWHQGEDGSMALVGGHCPNPIKGRKDGMGRGGGDGSRNVKVILIIHLLFIIIYYS